MFDKVKIYLSSYVYNILIHDMYTFECFKPNGEINKNDFLNVLIFNFYQQKADKKKRIMEALLKNTLPLTMSKENKIKILNGCADVLDEIYNEDPYRYHNCYFMFYPTGKTMDFFNRLDEEEMRNKKDRSIYLRSILNEYASLPQYVRENIIKRYELFKIRECIDGHRTLVFKTGTVERRIAPWNILFSRFERFEYLVGLDLNSKKRDIFAIKVYKIWNPVIGTKFEKLTKDEIKGLEEKTQYGPEYITGEMIETTIRLTKQGMRMADFLTENRPDMEEVQGNDMEFKVRCTLPNFLEYFKPFGKEAVVLDNEDLKQRMISFYQDAVDAYKQ